MTHDEWREATNEHDIAVSMGYESWEDVAAQTQLLITHGLAEIWINYKSAQLI